MGDIRLRNTSQMTKQSWLIPLLPLLEQTEACLVDLLVLMVPVELSTNSFRFASFTNAFTAALPTTSCPLLLALLIDTDLTSSSSRYGKKTIAPSSKVEST